MKSTFFSQAIAFLFGGTYSSDMPRHKQAYDLISTVDHTRSTSRPGRLKRQSKYIPAGPNRNCGWNGINPKMKARFDAEQAS